MESGNSPNLYRELSYLAALHLGIVYPGASPVTIQPAE